MRFFVLISVLFALAGHASAENSTIHIVDVKARPTAEGGATGAVYMVVMNHGAIDDDLMGATTPIADKAEIHRTTNENGVMRMQAVGDLPIKANDGVTFAPGGLHVMLIGLKQSLKLGSSFPLTLNFAKAGAVTVNVQVAPIKAGEPAGHDMSHMKM